MTGLAVSVCITTTVALPGIPDEEMVGTALLDAGNGRFVASADVNERVGEGVVINLVADSLGDAEEGWAVSLVFGLSGEEVL